MAVASSVVCGHNAIMPCTLGCLALLFPRVVLVLIWFFGNNYLQSVYQTLLWPLVGFLFMPLTTLAYAWAWHLGGGSVRDVGYIIIAVAAIIDLASLGGGASHKEVQKYYIVQKR